MVLATVKFLNIRNKYFRILFFLFSFFLFIFFIADSASASYSAQYWNITAGTSPIFPTGSANYTATTNDINFDWGNSSPAPGTINVDGFTARWTETKSFTAGTYYFSTTVDDGERVYIDDTLIINSWIDQGSTSYNATKTISSGTHTVKVEFYENSGGAVCQFSYYKLTPAVSTFTPSDGATGISPTTDLNLNFDQTVYTSSSESNDIVIKKASDNSTIETIDAKDAKVSGNGSSTITINPAATLEEQTAYYIQIGANAFYNGSDYYYNGISDTTTWNFTTGDFTFPTISEVTAVPSSTSAAISWATNEAATSQVQYGLTSSFGSTTTEADTSTRVTSHTVNLSNLHTCARYYYRVKSKDASSNLTTSSTQTFTTEGCDISSIANEGDEEPISTSGGSLSINTDSGTASLSIPADFYLVGGTPTSANFQINKLDDNAISGVPSGKDLYYDNFFDLLAATDDGTSVTNFDKSITFTVSYGSDAENQFKEDTLDIYKYSGGSWTKKNCTINKTANTLTCSLNSFSIYGILGEELEDSADIFSWKAEKYTDSGKSCSERLRLTIKGRHLKKDTEVKIGGRKASSVEKKSDEEIIAKFCLNKLLENRADRERKITVENPDTSIEEAKEEINLDDFFPAVKGSEKEKQNDNFYDQKTKLGAKNIQTALNKLGYLETENITSTYGTITTEAVKKFQSENGIEPTGFVGPLTSAELEKKVEINKNSTY